MSTARTHYLGTLDKKPMDRLLFVLTCLLTCVGIFMVYDASYAFSIEHFHGDSFHFVKRQFVWAAIGCVVMLITIRVPYWRWRGVAVFAVSIAALLLIGVLIPHVGLRLNGARRWIGHGAVQFQPSELAKLALVLYLAHKCSGGAKTLREFRQGLLPPLLVLGALVALVVREPDMGTAIVLGGTGLVVLFLAGARSKHMGALLGGALLLGTAHAISKSYSLSRLSTFLNPKADQFGAGYQVWHALIALGSGGLTGMGLGEGREKLYLPMANTDFIFPVIAEEWGLIGTLILLTVFFLVAWRGFIIAYHTKDVFGTLLAAGITTMITLQALLNISVATASLPNTGVPLPFISYGGSSLVLMMAGIGLLLNISCHPNGQGNTAKEPPAPSEHDWENRLKRPSYTPRREDYEPAEPAVHRIDRAKRRTTSAYLKE